MVVRSLILSLAALSCTSVLTAAELVGISVFPPEVSLTTIRDRQSVIVQARYADGITRDVTGSVEWSVAHPELLRREGNWLYPAADGQTQLTVTFEGQTATVGCKVERAGESRPISFKLDVMPVFMKAGCNTGSCHGAARGKDGFALSLFGYDPDGDHFRITRQQPGRRIDLAVPSASLLIEKSVGDVPHTGGKRFTHESELNATLLEWITAQCPTDPADQATWGNPGRNDPCPCGSGKKFKHCHGRLA